MVWVRRARCPTERPRGPTIENLRVESILDLPGRRTVSRPNMTRGRLVAIVLLGVLALASPSAAAPPCAEHELGSGAPAPRKLGPGAAPAEIIAAAASVIREGLGLSFSPAYKAAVCQGGGAFPGGLRPQLGVRAGGSAGRIVPAAAGIATPVGVFFRGDYLARAPLHRRVTVVAHE